MAAFETSGETSDAGQDGGLKDTKHGFFETNPNAPYRNFSIGLVVVAFIVIVIFSAIYGTTSTPQNCDTCGYQYTSCIITDLAFTTSKWSGYGCPTHIDFLYGLDNNDWNLTQTLRTETDERQCFPLNISVGQVQTCIINPTQTNPEITNTNYRMYKDSGILPLTFGYIYLSFIFCGVFCILTRGFWWIWMHYKPTDDAGAIDTRHCVCCSLCIMAAGAALLAIIVFIIEGHDSVHGSLTKMDVYTENMCSIQSIKDIQFYTPSVGAFGVVFYNVTSGDNEEGLIGVDIIDDLMEEDLYNVMNSTDIQDFGFLQLNSNQKCYENIDTKQIVLETNNPKINWLNDHIYSMNDYEYSFYLALALIICPCCCWLLRKCLSCIND